jgi:hypothetical protein
VLGCQPASTLRPNLVGPHNVQMSGNATEISPAARQSWRLYFPKIIVASILVPIRNAEGYMKRKMFAVVLGLSAFVTGAICQKLLHSSRVGPTYLAEGGRPVPPLPPASW